jgi:glyoxylase-like metal-dependent hydrolase (beta-lactamase superfamily II)
MILEVICVGALQTNCYVLAEGPGKAAVIIDPGDECERIKKVLKAHRLVPGLVVNTHGHYDHIGCDNAFGVPVVIHERDAALLNDPRLNLSGLFAEPRTVHAEVRTVTDGDSISLEGLELKVIATPGHTQGGISLLLLQPEENILFTGDTLFCQGIGRTDFPGASEDVLLSSIKDKLFVLPDTITVYPGHGDASTLGEEKEGFSFSKG